jgi:hypothetical protein
MKSRFCLLSVSLLVLSSCLLTFMGGCGVITPPEAVLSGNWSLTTTEASNLPPTTLTFDSSGNLTKVTFLINNGNVEYTATNSTTLVSGDTATITVAFGAGSLSFVGTLNSDNTVINGNLTTSLLINNLTVNLVGASGTLTKQ